MNLSELLANEALRQHEFPVVREKVFLAHAGVCPLPRRVAEAVREYAGQCTLDDQESFRLAHQSWRTRELAARLLHARPEEIALVGPTSLGLSFVAAGLDFRRQDNVVIYFDDFPSNVYPWLALAERGVEVRFVPTRELGVIRPADVLGQVDEQTRLVALASCHYLSGYRIDLERIGQALRARGILFCVDAIQTLGAFPTTVEHVDFLAADAHKWLLGPCGAGLLYVRREVQERLRPTVFGWHNVKSPDLVTQEAIVLRADARRYEAGTANWLGLVGLHAALALVLEVGVEAIAAELRRKREWLVRALQDKGCIVLAADVPPANASGIVSFQREGTDLAALHEKLSAANVVTSLRADTRGRRFLRLSPHFYNTDAELQRLVDML